MARVFRGVDTVKKSVKDAAATITSERIILIENSKILDNPLNDGLAISDTDKLAESLKETNGPIEPAVVWDMKDGTYMLVSGHRRRHAWCNVLGNKTLPCSVREYPADAKERFIIHAVANTQTREKDPFFWLNEIKHARKLLLDGGFSGSEAELKEEIHKLLGDGASPVQIARYEGFSKLEPELQSLCKYGLSASTLYSAVRLSSDEQRHLASVVEDHYSTPNVEELSREDFVRLVYSEKISRDSDIIKEEKKKPVTWSVKTTKLESNLLKKLKSAKSEDEKEAARTIISDLKEQIRLIEELLNN